MLVCLALQHHSLNTVSHLHISVVVFFALIAQCLFQLLLVLYGQAKCKQVLIVSCMLSFMYLLNVLYTRMFIDFTSTITKPFFYCMMAPHSVMLLQPLSLSKCLFFSSVTFWYCQNKYKLIIEICQCMVDTF